MAQVYSMYIVVLSCSSSSSSSSNRVVGGIGSTIIVVVQVLQQYYQCQYDSSEIVFFFYCFKKKCFFWGRVHIICVKHQKRVTERKKNTHTHDISGTIIVVSDIVYCYSYMQYEYEQLARLGVVVVGSREQQVVGDRIVLSSIIYHHYHVYYTRFHNGVFPQQGSQWGSL